MYLLDGETGWRGAGEEVWSPHRRTLRVLLRGTPLASMEATAPGERSARASLRQHCPGPNPRKAGPEPFGW